MKITATAAAAQFTITNEQGEVVASYSIENATFSTDISGLLKCVSDAAHLFKQLDATHNAPEPKAETPASHGRVGFLDRPREVQALIDAVRMFRESLPSDQSDVQHDVVMESYNTMREVREDASAVNVAEMVKNAKELRAAFCEVADKLTPRAIRNSAKLADALAAFN